MAFLSPRTLVLARSSLAAVPRAAPRLVRTVHSLPPYEPQIAPELGGASPFLSREAVHLVGTVYRQGLISRLNQSAQGTHMENLPIADVAIDAAQNPKFIHTYGYAAEVLNNAFFLHNLVRQSLPQLTTERFPDFSCRSVDLRARSLGHPTGSFSRASSRITSRSPPLSHSSVQLR